MSLKLLVNTPEIYQAFFKHLEEVITARQRTLEQLTEPSAIYRVQGQIAELRRLLHLRDEVNVKG